MTSVQTGPRTARRLWRAGLRAPARPRRQRRERPDPRAARRQIDLDLQQPLAQLRGHARERHDRRGQRLHIRFRAAAEAVQRRPGLELARHAKRFFPAQAAFGWQQPHGQANGALMGARSRSRPSRGRSTLDRMPSTRLRTRSRPSRSASIAMLIAALLSEGPGCDGVGRGEPPCDGGTLLVQVTRELWLPTRGFFDHRRAIQTCLGRQNGVFRSSYSGRRERLLMAESAHR